MQINSIPEINCLTPMQAWEKKNYQQQHPKSIIPDKNMYSFTYLVEVHHAGPQVYMDLKEKI